MPSRVGYTYGLSTGVPRERLSPAPKPPQRGSMAASKTKTLTEAEIVKIPKSE
jgi:hypothetical protein